MKLVAIVGSNASFSYNRLLLQFIKERFGQAFALEILEIKELPLFNQDSSAADCPLIQKLNEDILNADGIIIATAEHNQTITASLKSMLEWLSYQLHPFKNKPVMIVGTSYYNQGTSHAQEHLRQILNAPGLDAWVMPGNEFFLGNASEVFDENNQIKDDDTVIYLAQCLQRFIRYVTVVQELKGIQEDSKLPNSKAVSDATSGASESFEDAPITLVRAKKQSLPQAKQINTPFEEALDKIYGSALEYSLKDTFEKVLDGYYGKVKKQLPFEKALDAAFGADLGIETTDPLDNLLR
ncbi:NADPH-dependent FMN reductase [Streptococcus mutans]|uniref:NADPH-dependent FMN reductase n=1 Tax=Streptococcus mutans TaxID=1309 RepID=UPI0004674FD9|nr:NAD(P)H-dependent oxidoreductase [Streptococcus mutans]